MKKTKLKMKEKSQPEREPNQSIHNKLLSLKKSFISRYTKKYSRLGQRWGKINK